MIRSYRKLKTLLAILCTGALVLLSNSESMAQSKYGTDSIKCVENISVYREYVKQANYMDALPGWRFVFANCPASTEYMYLDGITLMKSLMSSEKDASKQRKYADTIMHVYDQRIQNFGKEGYVLGRKGVDVLNLYADQSQLAYTTLKKAYSLQSDKLEAAPCDAYFQAAIQLYKEGKVSKQEALEVYELVSDVIAKNLKQKPDDKYYLSAQEGVESKLGATDLADCNSLIEIFSPKFKANPSDPSVLKSITKTLSNRNCTESQLYLEAAVSLDKTEPSANSKSNIAKMYFAKGNYSEAAKYYNQAIDLETENDDKAQLYYELAAVNQKTGSLSSSRNNAQKAITLKPNWGAPYLLIGDLYASSSKECGDNDLLKKAVYWVAVDKYQQAKSVDPSASDEANKRISIYSKYFPPMDDVFFYSLKDGDTYTMGCWINESTKVRAIK
jgi:tetratricopeptide (TPR) repeat protein